jgi:hypothetical protein
MTIDFKNFKMYTDISQTGTVNVDVRRDFADMIYRNANGIMAHDIALRIYRSDGPMEINPEEKEFLTAFAQRGTPIFLDSFNANIKDEQV